MKPAPNATPARIALGRLLDLPEIPVAEAALRIAQEQYPDLDVAAYLGRLEGLGRSLAHGLGEYAGTDGSAADGTWTRADRLRALRNFLYGEHGFRGSTDEEFFDPRNSFLNDVLDRHRGLPITLALVFMEVGRAIGLELAGVNFPGHFLVKTVDDGPELLLDPFNNGREVTWVEAIDRIEQVRGRKEPPEDYTDPVSARGFLFRLLANLKACYLREERYDDAIAVVDRLLMVHPGAHWERRDRGLLELKLGWYHDACADLEAYLEAAPHADDRESIERRVEQARQLAAQLN